MMNEVSRLEKEIVTLKMLLNAAVEASNWAECSTICLNMSHAFKLLRLETEASTEGVVK